MIPAINFYKKRKSLLNCVLAPKEFKKMAPVADIVVEKVTPTSSSSEEEFVAVKEFSMEKVISSDNDSVLYI